MSTADAIEIVDQMDLEPSHVLTEEESEALYCVLGMAVSYRDLKRALDLEI